MSDSRRVHRAIKRAVKQLYPEEPRGNRARHLDTLAGMVTGIVLGKSCQLPKMAAKVPETAKPDSREKRFSRWVQNEALTAAMYFAVCVKLAHELGTATSVGVCDGCQRSGPGRLGLGGQRVVCPAWRLLPFDYAACVLSGARYEEARRSAQGAERSPN